MFSLGNFVIKIFQSLKQDIANMLVSVINDNFPFVSKTADHAFTDALGQNSMLVIFFNKQIIISAKGKDI